MGLFVIGLKLLDVLAWPLLALGYPLHASIVAIETNSSADAQKLVTYWVLFSLISLVEHALGTLLLWLPLWSYIKLAFIIWLMIPRFDGAFYVYENFIRPCLSISSRVITNGLKKRKELSLNGEDFLVEAEKYLNDNGPEVLEKLLSSQSMRKKPMDALKHVIAAELIEKEEVTAVEESRCNENIAAGRKDNGVDELEEGKVDKVAESGIRFGTVDDKEIPNTAKEVPKAESVQPPQESQREWTCALCQVRTYREHVLKSHLEGKKHKAAISALKAKKQSLLSKDARKVKVKEPDQSKRDGDNSVNGDGNKWKNARMLEKVKVKEPDQSKRDADNSVNGDGNKWKNARMLEKVKVKRLVSETGHPWCCICNVTCSGIGNFVAHCNGKKHMARIEELSCPNVGRQEDSANHPSL